MKLFLATLLSASTAFCATVSTNLYSIKQNDFTVVSNSLLSNVLTNYIKAGINITIVRTPTNIVINATASGTNAAPVDCGTNKYISSVSPSVIPVDADSNSGIMMTVTGCGFVYGGVFTVGEDPLAQGGINEYIVTSTNVYGLWIGQVPSGLWNLYYWETNELKATLTNAILITGTTESALEAVQTNNNIFTGVNTFSNLNGNGAGLTAIPLTAITTLGTIVTNGASFRAIIGSASAPSLGFTNDIDTGFFYDTANQISMSFGGNHRITLAGDNTLRGIALGGGTPLTWTAGSAPTANGDTKLNRSSAGTILLSTNLIVIGSLTATNGVINIGSGWTGTTNEAPADASTIRGWVNYTNIAGGVFKMPLYQ